MRCYRGSLHLERCRLLTMNSTTQAEFRIHESMVIVLRLGIPVVALREYLEIRHDLTPAHGNYIPAKNHFTQSLHCRLCLIETPRADAVRNEGVLSRAEAYSINRREGAPLAFAAERRLWESEDRFGIRWSGVAAYHAIRSHNKSKNAPPPPHRPLRNSGSFVRL